MTVDAEERLDTMTLLAAADPADVLRQVASIRASDHPDLVLPRWSSEVGTTHSATYLV